MNSYKFVHIFPYNLYTKPFLQFIKMHFPKEEHGFIVYGKPRNESTKIEEMDNIYIVSGLQEVEKKKEIFSLLKEAKKLFFHTNHSGVTNLLFRHPTWLKKTDIIFWGFDIYCYRNKPKGLKERFLHKIQKYQIRHIHGIGILAEKEEDVLRELIPGIKGTFFHVAYMQTVNYDRLHELRNHEKSKSPVKIMLGNSASETNCHFEILDRLKKYASEDLIIYCPLSYGDKEYATKVAEYGQDIFDNKFVPIRELLPLESYWEVLNECKIGLYNNNRQQAMGNISTMLCLGGKVYIRKDTSMWERFLSKGYSVYDISEIGNLDWAEILEISEKSIKKNMDCYDSLISMERRKKMWEDIFLSR